MKQLTLTGWDKAGISVVLGWVLGRDLGDGILLIQAKPADDLGLVLLAVALAMVLHTLVLGAAIWLIYGLVGHWMRS